MEYAKKARFQEVADYLQMETKKNQEHSKMPNQNAGEESVNENTKRKKKDALTLNNNKNTYKITVMNENGEIHDLTEDEVKELMKNSQELENYLTNPDNIPQELLESTLQESW